MKATSEQTIAKELLDKLSTFDLKNKPNDIEFRKLLNDAKKLEKVDILEGSVILGILYTRNNDYNKAKQYFEKALKISTDSTVILNYSESLKLLGRFQEAYDLVEKYYRSDDEGLVYRAYINSIGIGLFNKAVKFAKALELFPSYNSERTQHTENILQLLESRSIDNETIHNIYLLVLSVIYRNEEEPINSMITESVDDGSLIIMFYTEANSENISNMQFDLINKYIELDISSNIKDIVTPVILNGTR